MTGLQDSLRILEEAAGDPALIYLATVDLKYPELSPADRASLRAALEATAVPHWCDPEILAGLLGIERTEATGLWERLSRLAVVESFRSRGDAAHNVHSAARSAIRRRLAETDMDRFRSLSERAAVMLPDDDRAAARIERIYHTLLTDPDDGIRTLEQASSGWMWSVSHEVRFALRAALDELVQEGFLTPHAAAWARTLVLAHRFEVVGAAGVHEALDQLLGEAREYHDTRLLIEILTLVGESAVAGGDLDAARAAFEECRSRMAALAAENPANAQWQREVALVHARLGNVAQESGDLDRAGTEYEQGRVIFAALAASDPDSANWRVGLANAYARIGDVAMEKGDESTAEDAFHRYQSIMAELATRDPGNTSLRRNLAVAYSKVGNVALRKGDFDGAEQAYRRFQSTMADLTAQDPSNNDWQRELGVSWERLGDVAYRRDLIDDALAAYEMSRSIRAGLAAQDPGNVLWRRDLAFVADRIEELTR
jgi:tetratricopeptide (TPR) repeat protein